MQEIWKPIKNYEILYEVSNLGRVKSLDRFVNSKSNTKTFRPGKILKCLDHRKDYLYVELYDGNKGRCKRPIHRLVAETFIENIEYMDVVNHIDGNKFNNCVTNLEWCTHSYNCHHAIQNGLFTAAKGEQKTKMSKLKERDVLEIRERYKNGESQYSIASSFSVGQDNISRIVNRKYWKHI